MFNQSSKKRTAKYGKYTDLQTYFSGKNTWRSSQELQDISVPKIQRNRSVLSNKIGCGYDRNELLEHSSLSYIRRRSDFQAKLLKETQK